MNNNNGDDDNDSCSSAVASGVSTDDTSSVVSDEISSHLSEFCVEDEEDDDNDNDNDNDTAAGDHRPRSQDDNDQHDGCPRRYMALEGLGASSSGTSLWGTNFVAFGLATLVALVAHTLYKSSAGTSGASQLTVAIAVCTSRIAKQMYRWYMRVLEERPVLTKSLTTGIIQFLGDGSAQWYEQHHYQQQQQQQQQQDLTKHDKRKTNGHGKDQGYDVRRGVSLFVDGLVISGPLLHYCYELMEEAWPTSSDEGGLLERPLATLCQVFVNDYFIDTFYIAISVVFTGMVEGYSWSETKELFWKDYWATVRASWLVSLCLLPVEIFCFGYLSLSLRVLAMNFVDLLWGSIVSFYSHRSRREGFVSENDARVAIQCNACPRTK